MPKFFVEKENKIDSEHFVIRGEDVNHIRQVLRLNLGDKIEIGCLEYGNFACCIESISDEVVCKIEEKLESIAEPKTKITVFQGLPKQEKMEWILQKGTELGMENLVPVQMNRCIVKLDGKDAEKKIERWQKIVESAAKQSRRDKIPKVEKMIKMRGCGRKNSRIRFIFGCIRK